MGSPDLQRTQAMAQAPEGTTMDVDIWKLEERLWREGASVYDALVSADCLMAFPGVGILRGAATIARSLEGTPRWTEVAMHDRALSHPAADLLVLAYRAEARRPGLDRYVAWCTSTWHERDGGWQLVQHQHSLSS